MRWMKRVVNETTFITAAEMQGRVVYLSDTASYTKVKALHSSATRLQMTAGLLSFSSAVTFRSINGQYSI